jgi:hypothetical protein
MKRKPAYLTTVTTIAALATAISAWGAESVPITNAGFEDPVVADGATGVATAWADVGTGGGTVFNPTTSQYAAEAPEGDNVASLFAGADGDGFSQTLSGATGQLQADATYALTVQVGDPADVGFDGYKVQFLADGTVLAEDDNTVVPLNGEFAPATVNYVYNATLHSALLGQPLEIRLLTKGLASGETNFDDVQLTVTLANPVANPGGPYSVPIGGSLMLDGSGSLPSDGQAITLYEWDLNNDGTYDVTGVMPTAITRSDLETLWGMTVGDNDIVLRVTDDSGTPKTATSLGTVTLPAPIAGQLGVLDLNANGGINPNTGVAWAAGDRYRLAFYTDGTTTSTSNDPQFYYDFVDSQAWLVPALQKSYWAPMITLNLDSSFPDATAPLRTVKEFSGTTDSTGGAGVGGAGDPVYVMDGTTCIARNNADIWNSWSNPFDGDTTVRVPGVHYSPFLTQNGVQLFNPDGNHGASCATGCNNSGGTVRPLGNSADADATDLNWGSSNANNSGRVWNRFGGDTTSGYRLYVISYPLTVVDLAETTAPTVTSFVDDRAGADAILSLDSIVYTVTFDEAVDISTLTTTDFGNTGGATASITVDRIRPTFDPAVFEVTVTPTSTGTLQLGILAAADVKDLVGNALDTGSAISDDTIITVVSDVTAPTLTSIVDDRGGANLLVGTGSIVYTVTFDEAMNASTVELADFENGGTATLTIDSVAATGDPAVYEVTVTPTTAGTAQLQIAMGANLTDLVGNPLDTSAALPDDTVITIDPDNIAPVVNTLIPADDATGIGTGPVLTATFSEDIAKGTGNIEIRKTSDDSVVETIDVTTGAVTVSGAEAAVTLASPLDTFTGYYVLIDSGAITDLFANDFAGIALKTTWNFETGEFGLLQVTADGQTFSALFEEYDGKSWVLIGRGREGWEFDTDGQGTPAEVGLNLKDPAGFAPKAFSDAIVNDLLAQTARTFPADVELRVMRASTTDGSGDYQELRYTNFTGFPNGNSEFTFFFDDTGKFADVERVNAPAGLSGASTGTGNATIHDHQAGGNDGDRIFTWAWGNHNNLKGFATGQTVGGTDNNDPNTFLWEFTTENHAIPYTEVWLQLEVPSSGGNPYGTWAMGFGGLSDDDPDLDFDDGGLETGIEWVVGGDPTDPSDDTTLAPTFDNTTDPDKFLFVFRRTDDANGDANTTIAVEYGSDLVGWTVAVDQGVDPGDITITEDDDFFGVGVDKVTVAIPRSLAVGDQLFARLSVAVAQP